MPTETDPLLDYVRVPIDAVREHPENARDDASMALVRESIDTHNQYVPILVQRSTGLIAKGNHTHRVLVERRHPLVDVIYRDMTDDQCRRIMLMDNASSDKAGYRVESLAGLLQSLDGDLTGTGYTDTDLAALLASVAEPDFQPDDSSQARLDQREATTCPSCSYRWRVGPGGAIEPVE